MKAFKINPTIINGKGAFLSMLILTLALLISGCSNNPLETFSAGTGTGSGDNITLSVQSADNITDNADIQINEAKGLLTEIEIESDSSVKRIKTGPVVVPLNVAGINQVMASGVIPTGTYKKIKFQLHKPEDNESIPDSEFREGSSGNQRYSFIVKGNYNGSSFVYKSRKTINIVISLTSPLILTAKSNLTILFDKIKWFQASGGVTIDPSSSSNDDAIDDNIKNSFKKAFKDDDSNGVPDDH